MQIGKETELDFELEDRQRKREEGGREGEIGSASLCLCLDFPHL